MRILALESYYGGSHKAFLDGWTSKSQHNWTLLTEPANMWKWRMRTSAVTFATQVDKLINDSETWDAIFCSDMLNLAEFLGLANKKIRSLPVILYFHENQLTYPTQIESERDYQYVTTNMTSALAADQVWFNSAFHKNEWLSELAKFITKMPKNARPKNIIDQISNKSKVQCPGIDPFNNSKAKTNGPLKILWAARWEFDKNPEDFFAALKLLKADGIDFRLNVIGEHFQDVPEIFKWAKQHFADNIDRWGYQQTYDDYCKALIESDVVVSTANHEFFGLSIVEAIAAGCYPALPKRLSYPEITADIESDRKSEFLYSGSVQSLYKRLKDLSLRFDHGPMWRDDPTRGIRGVEKFFWSKRAVELDKAVTEII